MALVPLPDKFQIRTAKSVQDWLFLKNIEISVKLIFNKLCVRLSVHLYNSFDDILKLSTVILKEN